MKTLHFAVLLHLFLMVSCVSDSGSQKKDTASMPPHKSLSERMNEKNGYKQDANGNWVAQSDRRSPYESQGNTYDSKKEFKKSAYRTGDYAKKSWWGNKEYERQTYSGNTDGSRFEQASALQGETAPEAGNNARIPGPYKTGSYATGTARETGNKAISKPSNAIVDSREKVFKQPEIIDWRAQRNLSLDQSRGILGR